MVRDLLVSLLNVDVNTGVETLVVEAVLGTGVEAVFAAEVATVVLVDADVLLSAYASGSGTAAVVFRGGDADVLADALLVTGRAGLLGLRWFLTFPSSALDRYLLLSLDLLGLFVVLVGRRKDAERDSAKVSVGVSVWCCCVCVCSAVFGASCWRLEERPSR